MNTTIPIACLAMPGTAGPAWPRMAATSSPVPDAGPGANPQNLQQRAHGERRADGSDPAFDIWPEMKL